MLQGSVDGDPAAPAGFAEALSERAQKSTPRGAFFMPGIWCELKYQQHHKPTVGGLELRLVLAEDQTTLFIDRDLTAWITIHAHRTFLAIQGVTHVIADDLVADVVDGVTAGLRGGVGIAVLHAFLNLVTGVAATDRTGYGG